MSSEFFDSKGRYTQNNFGKQPVFSSFLPGIAGAYGIPAWCNYNNRGQAVSSFGVQDKDHAMMEFTDAQTAYRQVSLTGFRTFLKSDGVVDEAFSDGSGAMTVEMNALLLSWENDRFSVEVLYFIMPGERIPGLCRRIKITGLTGKTQSLEILDGPAAFVPFGLSDNKLKKEAHLSTAWIQVEHLNGHIPCFSVRASLEDISSVHNISGKNFRFAFAEDGEPLPAVTDPELVFGWDTSLRRCIMFENTALSDILSTPQQVRNTFPCCFTPWSGYLKTNHPLVIWEFYGQSEDANQITAFCGKICSHRYFDKKVQEAENLGETVSATSNCATNLPLFDQYVKQNYLDNVLRGGLPAQIGVDSAAPPVYLYTRRHGDPEREYNAFYLTREYFSHGNASFRDLCQNRRSDVWFCPPSGKQNLRIFFELLQIDGYNPLILSPLTYKTIHPEEAAAAVPPRFRSTAVQLLEQPFTPGRLVMAAEDAGIPDPTAFLACAIARSEIEPRAVFQDGYWSDHWTYLLDLLESELAIFPDREKNMLWAEQNYRWFRSPVKMIPQSRRYEKTDRGLRQYRFLEQRVNISQKWETEKDGQVARSCLGEKLILLCAVKYAALDSSGAAVEMEGGKPGWCDALNGLPGLFGSSIPEACELIRLSDFLIDHFTSCGEEIELYEEIALLLDDLLELEKLKAPPIEKWIKRNEIRDRFRASVENGWSGQRKCLCVGDLRRSITRLASSLRDAVINATEENGGISPTYFYYEVESFSETAEGLLPTALRRKTLPLFLEGPARWIKAEKTSPITAAMPGIIRNSALFDQKLGMYKICAPLKTTNLEIGRIAAFPPGWLENESVWLHMEYKYLLSLLSAKQYKWFLEGFETMLIPALSPERYGRSTLENSSFLMSSAHPDRKSHGRGYIARLSGSTAEFISIWNIMLYGPQPFRMINGHLALQFEPFIPKTLLRSDGTIAAVFLGHTRVIFHADGLSQLYPGDYAIHKYEIKSNHHILTIVGSALHSTWAEYVRSGKADEINVFFTSKDIEQEHDHEN